MQLRRDLLGQGQGRREQTEAATAKSGEQGAVFKFADDARMQMVGFQPSVDTLSLIHI